LDDYYKLMNPQGKIYLFLDEIQFFKNWQVFIKSKYENSNIKFIITGSNSQLLSSELITLLSGRTLNIYLYPFDFKEFLLAKKIEIKSKIDLLKNQNLIRKHFDEFVRWGGFPEIAFIKDNNTKKEILENYYKNILYHDIIPRFGIKNIDKTEKLAHYLLSNIGKPFSYNKLSKLIALSDKTVKEYTNYFSKAYLLFELKHFDFSIKKQINTPKKVYAIDTGLINSISFKFTEDIGRLYENLVFVELKRRGKEIYYHKDMYECDFIVKEESKITQAIQVCKSIKDPDTRKREILGIKEAIKKYKLKTALILTENEEEIINKEIQAIPLWKWLLE